jgi:NAD-dependent SIR2 family protein deacetylase
MILHRVSTPIHSMCEHPHCPRCGQPILVAEIDEPESKLFSPIEQQIVCPQCYGFIAALISLKRVVTYPAPVGDYMDELEEQDSELAV